MGIGGAHSRHSGKMDEQLRDDYHIPPNPTTTLPKPTTTMAHEYKKTFIFYMYTGFSELVPLSSLERKFIQLQTFLE